MLLLTDYNSLTLAYLGDAIYELKIRDFLIKKGITKVNNLQHEAINYVSAKNQSKYLEIILKELKEDELIIMNRARNHKGSRHPKNVDIITYKYATAFEAIFGYLYLNKSENRIDELISIITKEDN